MYEGKNIHFSSLDNKPLCSFSVKLCKQRRLNGYAFCLRHVLEDSSAPFKQCSFVSKSKQRCSNPIPKSRNTEYCNSHMQIQGHTGKEKSKEKEVNKDVKEEIPTSNGISSDNKLSLEDRLKNKFNLHHKEPGANDFEDDPYAFPDTDPHPLQLVGKTSPIIKPSPTNTKASNAASPKPSTAPMKTSTLLGLSSSSPEHNNVAPNKVAPPTIKTTENRSGMSSIAKLYPELAEKLERVRTKTDSKQKSPHTKSSRTMNRLQTKIAQNKIKDKLKKTQGQSINSSCSTTPEQPGTPVTPQSSAPIVDHKPLISPVATSRLYASEATTNISWTPNPVTTSYTQQMASLSQSWPPANPPNYAVRFPVGSHAHLPLGKDNNTHTPALPYVPPYTAPDIKVPPFLPVIHTQGVTSLQASLESLSSSQPFPNQFPFQQHTPPAKPASGRPSQLTSRAKRPKNVLSETEARKRLKRHSAVKVYAYHASRIMNKADLLPMGVDSSDNESDFNDDLPCQQYWVTTSSDEENGNDDELDEEVNSNIRKTKLGLYKSKLRRQFVQLRKTYHGNVPLRSHQSRALQALIQSAKYSTEAASRSLQETKLKGKKCHDKHEELGLCPGKCTYRCADQKQDVCHDMALPFTNHCINHIMYNVDQQMFDYCTAKFSDNTQCCIPVFDVRHELPLCTEHAAKADNYQKNHEPKPKKPRKKTKPSALTRPPKKGKKKKNQKRNVRPQKPTPPLTPTGNTDVPPPFTPEASGTSAAESSPLPAEQASSGDETPTVPVTTVASAASTAAILDANLPKVEGELVDLGGDLEESFSPGTIGKDLDLPLDSDQAAKFLDEHDLHDVFNKLPDEAFELIAGKNGEFMSSKEEAEFLEAFAEASKEFGATKDPLEKLSQHADSILIGENTNEDELTKQIADSLLNQNMGSPTGSLSDDLSTDNLNALASSLSANDLKSISQVLTTSVINSALGSESIAVSQGGIPVDQRRILEQIHQEMPQRQIQQGQIVQPSQQPAPPAISNFPIIQARLAQGPLLTPAQQGSISTGAITSISVNGAAMSSMSKTHELFSSLVGSSATLGMSRPAENINVPSQTLSFPGSLTQAQLGPQQIVQLGSNHLQIPPGLEGILVPMQNPNTLNTISNTSTGVSVNAINVTNGEMKAGTPVGSFQNGLPPINAAFHGHTLAPGGMGVKLTYPVQMLPGGMLTGGHPSQTIAITSQSSLPTQQLYAISTTLPQSQQNQVQQTLPNS